MLQLQVTQQLRILTRQQILLENWHSNPLLLSQSKQLAIKLCETICISVLILTQFKLEKETKLCKTAFWCILIHFDFRKRKKRSI